MALPRGFSTTLSNPMGIRLDVDILRPSRSGVVCINCQQFRHEVGKHCVTQLTCPIHQGLIPQGEHLTKRCSRWVARREV
jgi:hypothetical protein